MKAQVAFHNVDHSAGLQHFIEQRSEILQKFLWNGEDFNWVIEHDAQNFQPKLKLSLNNKNILISSKAKNVYKAVNEVLAKAKSLIIRGHGKINHQHSHGKLNYEELH